MDVGHLAVGRKLEIGAIGSVHHAGLIGIAIPFIYFLIRVKTVFATRYLKLNVEKTLGMVLTRVDGICFHVLN